MGWETGIGIASLITALSGTAYSIYQAEKQDETVYEPPDPASVETGASEAAAKKRRALAGRYGSKQTDITGGMDLGLGNILKKRLGG